jgi:hypothetical protein
MGAKAFVKLSVQEGRNPMDAVTFGGVRTPTTTAVEIKLRKSFFARFVDALKESRRLEARRFSESHADLLPPDQS